MKIGIDWNQPSTMRGAIWCVVAIVGAVGWWMGKDVSGIVSLGMGVAGGLGVAVKD